MSRRLFLALCSAAAGAGCATGLDRHVAAEQAAVERSVSVAKDAYGGAKPMVSTVNGAWLGAKVVTRPEKADYPAVFAQSVTMRYPEPVPLAVVAERVTMLTGIPVRVAPEVHQKPSSGPAAPALAGTGPLGADGIVLDYAGGTLSKLLDALGARLGASWQYVDQTIRLYRYETRTYVLNAVPASSQTSATVASAASSGNAGTSGSGGNGGGTAQNTEVSAKLSVWDSVDKAIQTMLSPGGKAAMSMATGSITVTDVPEVVERVGRLIREENRRLARQVNIKVHVYSVAASRQQEYGVNWNIVFSRLNGDRTAKFKSPLGTVAAGAGQFGINIIKSEAAAELVFKALATQGDTSLVTSAAVTTLNNQPVPVSVQDELSYIERTNTTQTINVGTTTSITPAKLTTGFALNLLPHVIENDTVLMQYAIDLSSLEDIKTRAVSGAVIDTPEVSRRNIVQRTALKNGETLMLTGFERTVGSRNRTGFLENLPALGGNAKGSLHKEALVVLITPQIVEGAD